MDFTQEGKSETPVLQNFFEVRSEYGGVRGSRGSTKGVRGECEGSRREYGSLAFSPLIQSQKYILMIITNLL
jgi:hypothetical protein